LDHSLPPLGLFFANQIHFPISKSTTLVWAQSEIIQKIHQVPKTPPFSYDQNSLPQETKFCIKSILDKSKNSNSKIRSGWLIHLLWP
jgi:hypothetical protein